MAALADEEVEGEDLEANAGTGDEAHGEVRVQRRGGPFGEEARVEEHAEGAEDEEEVGQPGVVHAANGAEGGPGDSGE